MWMHVQLHVSLNILKGICYRMKLYLCIAIYSVDTKLDIFWRIQASTIGECETFITIIIYEKYTKGLFYYLITFYWYIHYSILYNLVE